MKQRHWFLPLKEATLPSLLALALAGSASAVSPYDTAYGLQWNFMTGTTGQDAFSLETAVTSDGTVFVTNRTSLASWGSGATGSVNSGVGAITPLGKLLYGTTMRSLPGMTSPGQNYLSGINVVGNTAYFGINGSGTQYWSGQDTSDTNRVMTFSLDSSGLGSIANQHRLTKYKDNVGTLRTDGLGPILPGGGLNQPAANRSADSALRASTLDMIIVGNSNSEFAFAGDYGGSNFGCFVGRYNLGTNTLTGPQYQPVVYDGSNVIVRGDYTRAGVDQTTGRYYAAGVPNGAGATFDPDGIGGASPLALDSTASTNGLVVAYDPVTPPSPDTIAYTVLWDSPTVGTTAERINAIAPTNDGTNTVFFAGYTTGDMPGFIGTNANPTVNSDSYIELRDATGALVWADQTPASSVSDGIQSANVDSNGDLYVSGYAGEPVTGKRDSWVRKYKKTGPGTYAIAWTSFVVNPLDSTNTVINDQLFKHALDSDGEAIYLAVQAQGTWPNTTGHVYSGTSDDILVQKMSPGDFNSDGLVDFADVQIAGTATKPGLTGNDTYDFNRDGDSTLADTIYMITDIMDRVVGDIAQDAQVTDVDNADIGRAIGALGVGTLYLDGDLDWDGDVQNDDLTAVAAAFTGAKTPGKWANGTPGATLRYRASDGQVWIHADESTGGIVTSFQLENSAGTFVPANFTGPTGGSFGGTLEEAASNVLADTDLTLAGASGDSGLVSLGTVFPTGLDQAGLEAYLTTAVYTGQPGSGQMQFTLLVGDLLPPYETWAGGPFSGPLTNIYANIDFEGDGILTGLEYVLGGDPTANDAATIAPTSQYTGSGLEFTFRRADLANEDPNATITVRYSTDLENWVAAEHGVGGVSIVVTNDFYGASPGIDRVVVTMPSSLAPNGKLFARLGVSGLPFSLFSEDFENDNGAFTVFTAGGTFWEHGVVNSPTSGGGAVTSGNSGTKCWGTNLIGVYGANTETKLRSPVIDLSGVTTAILTFAQAIDIKPDHTLVVNVIEEATDTVLQSAIHTSTPDLATTTASWESITVATPITGGQKVRIEWHFVGDGDGFYLGAYIDDVTVTTP